MSNQQLRESAMELVRVLRPLADVERARRVDAAISNDGRVIRDRVIGLITMIENHDQALAEDIANELGNILDGLNDPATGTFLYDSFDDVDGTLLTAHTGTIGATWTSDGGTATIHNGRVYGTGTGFLYASGDPPIADYKIEAEYTYFDDAGENGIAARIQPGENTGYYLHYNVGAFKLIRQVAGTGTLLKTVPYSSASLPVTAGFAISGDRIDIFVDGAVVESFVDGAPIVPAGRAGLRPRPISSTTGQHLDKVRGSAYVAQVKDVQDLVGALDTALNGLSAPPGTPATIDTLNTTLRNVLDGKRATADPISQSDVTNLPQDLTDILTDIAARATDTDLNNLNNALTASLATKRDEGVDISQADITNLTTALASKLESGAPQSAISGLVSALDGITGDVDTVRDREQVRQLTSAEATNSVFFSTIGNLSFSLVSNATYIFEAYIDVRGTAASDGNFNGVVFSVLPFASGVTYNLAVSGEATAGSFQFDEVTTSAAISDPFLTSGQTGRISINGRVATGANAGAFAVRYAVVDGGDQVLVAMSTFARMRRTDL